MAFPISSSSSMDHKKAIFGFGAQDTAGAGLLSVAWRWSLRFVHRARVNVFASATGSASTAVFGHSRLRQDPNRLPANSAARQPKTPSLR